LAFCSETSEDLMQAITAFSERRPSRFAGR
jgi:hypothetical protein